MSEDRKPASGVLRGVLPDLSWQDFEEASVRSWLPDEVSELSWWTRRKGGRDRYLGTIRALRRAHDEWVLWDGFHPGEFVNRGHEWVQVGEGQPPAARWSTAEVVDMVPNLIVGMTLERFPQMPRNELVVLTGFLPDD